MSLRASELRHALAGFHGTIREEVALAPLTHVRIGGAARFFLEPKTETAVSQIVRVAKEFDQPIHVLGGGSNVVLPRDFDGVTISLGMRGVKVDSDPDRSRLRVVVQSGENWHSLVRLCMGKGIFGLENLALIPGNVGAAPIQNIGAYGVEVSEFVDFVEAMEVKTGRVVKLTNEECGFGYRDSVFKGELAGSLVVTAVGPNDR